VAGVSEPTIDVLIADDDPFVRFGLSMMLRGAADLRVVAEAGDGRRRSSWPTGTSRTSS
jgi:DNA-binding NarL/FixJ family response regulator